MDFQRYTSSGHPRCTFKVLKERAVLYFTFVFVFHVVYWHTENNMFTQLRNHIYIFTIIKNYFKLNIYGFTIKSLML